MLIERSSKGSSGGLCVTVLKVICGYLTFLSDDPSSSEIRSAAFVLLNPQADVLQEWLQRYQAPEMQVEGFAQHISDQQRRIVPLTGGSETLRS